MVVAIGIGIGGRDGLVIRVGIVLRDVALPQGHEGDDEPAAGLADEHLGSLNHGLLEELVVLWIGVIAVADALVILSRNAEYQYVVRVVGNSLEVRTWYLVRSVLHTPVSSIIPTRNGMAALFAMMIDGAVVVAPEKSRRRRIVS